MSSTHCTCRYGRDGRGPWYLPLGWFEALLIVHGAELLVLVTLLHQTTANLVSGCASLIMIIVTVAVVANHDGGASLIRLRGPDRGVEETWLALLSWSKCGMAVWTLLVPDQPGDPPAFALSTSTPRVHHDVAFARVTLVVYVVYMVLLIVPAVVRLVQRSITVAGGGGDGDDDGYRAPDDDHHNHPEDVLFDPLSPQHPPRRWHRHHRPHAVALPRRSPPPLQVMTPLVFVMPETVYDADDDDDDDGAAQGPLGAAKTDLVVVVRNDGDGENDRSADAAADVDGQEKGGPPPRMRRRGSSYSETSCPICLDDFVPDTTVSQLACQHIFHGVCIRTWLERRNVCPVCRR